MSKTLRLLQIEDSESDADMILRLLMQGGFEVTSHRVEDAEGLRQALEDPPGTSLLRITTCRGLTRPAPSAFSRSAAGLPCIVVSGKMGEDTAVEMMKSGAHDYLTKNNLTRLVPCRGARIGGGREYGEKPGEHKKNTRERGAPGAGGRGRAARHV